MNEWNMGARVTEAIEWPVHWLRNAARVMRGPLPPHLRWRVLRTQTALTLRALGPGSDRPARCVIGPYAINSYSLTNLALLFREVFVDLDYYFATAKRAPYILDCGSNIGVAVVFFKTLYPNARVVGFEPGAKSYEMLQRNVEGNHLQDVAVHQVAVGDFDGTIEFFDALKPGSVTSSTRIERTGGIRTSVDQVRLSAFIDREVDFLKMDIEGGEWAVLDDLLASGSVRRVAAMTIEYHHHMSPSEDRLGEFLRRLEDAGFGYQLRAASPRSGNRTFQDVLVQAYRKDGVEAG